MMRLYNLVKEYATQIQAVHRKKKWKNYTAESD